MKWFKSREESEEQKRLKDLMKALQQRDERDGFLKTEVKPPKPLDWFERILRWVYLKFEGFKREAAELAKFRAEAEQRDKERQQLREFERKRKRHEYALGIERNVRKRQDNCTHLKGGRRQPSSPAMRDYNVSNHRFIDGSWYIKCLLCGRIWRPGETGWLEATKMVQQSTNTPTASETVVNMPIVPFKQTYMSYDKTNYKPPTKVEQYDPEKHGPDSIS